MIVIIKRWEPKVYINSAAPPTRVIFYISDTEPTAAKTYRSSVILMLVGWECEFRHLLFIVHIRHGCCLVCFFCGGGVGAPSFLRVCFDGAEGGREAGPLEAEAGGRREVISLSIFHFFNARGSCCFASHCWSSVFGLHLCLDPAVQ